MDISLDRLTDIVALSLGEYPDWREHRGRPGVRRDLSEMTAAVAEIAALDVTLATQASDFSSPVDMRLHIYKNAEWDDSDDTCTTELPADFLRLHSLRMSDWGRTLGESEANGEDAQDPQRSFFSGKLPEWFRRRALRPWVRVESTGVAKTLLFGPSSHRLPALASYIARPYYDEASLELCKIEPTLLGKIAEAIAMRIREEK